MTDQERFSPRPRAGSGPSAPAERWPSLEAALVDLIGECSEIVARGRPSFDAARSLTYRAAEAVIIHFDDLLGRLPSERAARLPPDLSLAAVRRTRNILSHDYRKAQKDIVWDAIEQRIPAVVLALLD